MFVILFIHDSCLCSAIFAKAEKEKNAKNFLIAKSKELTKIYIDNWNRKSLIQDRLRLPHSVPGWSWRRRMYD